MTKQRDPFQTIGFMTGGLVALFLICTTVLMALNKDITPFLIVGNMVVTPLLGLLGVKAYQQMTSQMKNLTDQVNGRMTTLIDHAANSVPLNQVEKLETK